MDDPRPSEPLAIDGGRPVRTGPLPWELPGSHWIGEEELALIGQVVKTRSPFRYYGPDLQQMAERLEEAFRRRIGRNYALAVGSGSAALTVALGALATMSSGQCVCQGV